MTKGEFAADFRRRLPLILLMFLGSMFLHAYLVYLNNGFDPGKDSAYTPFINVDDNPGASPFLIFGALSALGWSLFRTILTQGPVRAITVVVMQPVHIAKRLASSTLAEYGCWAVGGGVALICASLLGANLPAGFSVAILWTCLGMSHTGRIVAQWIFDALTHSLGGQLGRMHPSLSMIEIVIAAIAPGFALAAILGSPSIQFVTGGVAMAAGVILVFTQGPKGSWPNTAGQVSILFLIGCGGAVLYSLAGLLWPRKAFASDFGWAVNGSFINAITTGGIDGVIGVIQRGITPSLGASLGPLAPAVRQTPAETRKIDAVPCSACGAAPASPDATRCSYCGQPLNNL